MQCYVYKGDRKDDYYLYLDHKFDLESPPEKVPSAILGLMGELRFVIEFELSDQKKLAQAKKDMDALEDAYFN